MGAVLFLAALGASGGWRAAAVVPSSATNGVVLSWGSLGSGTRYYVQTSTDLLTWTDTTNTTATEVGLVFTGDSSRSFRLWASNVPPQSVMLAWDPSVPSADVTSYSIYYGVSTKNYTNLVNVGLRTDGVVSNLVAGTTYYFAVTAHASSGLESDFSDEALWQSSPQLRIQRLPNDGSRPRAFPVN